MAQGLGATVASVPGQAWSHCIGPSSVCLYLSLTLSTFSLAFLPMVSSFYLPGFCFFCPFVPLGLVLFSLSPSCVLCGAQGLRARGEHKCRVFGAGSGLPNEVGESPSLARPHAHLTLASRPTSGHPNLDSHGYTLAQIRSTACSGQEQAFGWNRTRSCDFVTLWACQHGGLGPVFSGLTRTRDVYSFKFRSRFLRNQIKPDQRVLFAAQPRPHMVGIS